jgi:general secretion pathway protein G
MTIIGPIAKTLQLARTSQRRGSRARRSAQHGFTLIEMLVVISIIGLIMALVGPRVLNYLSDSKTKTAKIQIESFESSLDLYFLDAGRYPTGSEGLTALVQKPGNIASWNGPYLKGSVVPTDPWGHPYVYRAPGQHGAYDIISYGSDGQEGGIGAAGDITNWEH